MATWNSRGLRGSELEELINLTNEKYREKKLALIQKIPTPIKPIQIDKTTRHITLAYFDQRSTVDYIGTVQGVPVCFDAKECRSRTFPIQNIHRNIRFCSCRILKNRAASPFCSSVFPEKDGIFTCPLTGWQISGTVRKPDMPKVFILKNWTVNSKSNVPDTI